MNQKLKKEILKKAQEWFSSSIAEKHIKNTLKLTKVSEFDIYSIFSCPLSLKTTLLEKLRLKVLLKH